MTSPCVARECFPPYHLSHLSAFSPSCLLTHPSFFLLFLSLCFLTAVSFCLFLSPCLSLFIPAQLTISLSQVQLLQPVQKKERQAGRKKEGQEERKRGRQAGRKKKRQSCEPSLSERQREWLYTVVQEQETPQLQNRTGCDVRAAGPASISVAIYSI